MSGMHGVYLGLFVAGVLVTLGLVAGLYSQRIGFSHMLVFLLIGMLAGVDGPLGLPFGDTGLAVLVGNLALSTILLDGGLRTAWPNVRAGAGPATLLATVGVLLTAAITGGIACLALGIDWRHGLLLGAVVASTDAAAVFTQMAASGVRLPQRVLATIEVESGLNDPMAMCLVLGLIGVLQHPVGAAEELMMLLLRQLGLGLLIGVAGGWLTARLLARLRGPLNEGADSNGLTALLLGALGLCVFALAGVVDGSGFLAVYLMGLMVARRRAVLLQPALPALNGYTWLAQAGLFLLLGLLVTPHQLLGLLGPALAIGFGLMLVARPLAVMLCLSPLGFGWREQVFVSWVGLRGAVPIVLAGYPVLAGVPGAGRFFDISFMVVLLSLLLQGPSIGWLARRLGLAGAEAGTDDAPPGAAPSATTAPVAPAAPDAHAAVLPPVAAPRP